MDTRKNLLIFTLLIGLLIFFSKISAQPNIEWEKSFGGSEIDNANYINQTIDGGFIIAGISSSQNGDVSSNNGKTDYWIVKLDANGELEWEKNFGGSENDYASRIEQTNDGGFIVAGNSFSDDGDVSNNHGLYDIWILKLNNIGELEWEKSFGGTNWEQAVSIKQTVDSGYIVVGNSSSNDEDVSGNNGMSDYWIVKLDANGELEWEKNFGGSENDYANSAEQTTDGGYIIAGYSFSNDGDVGSNKGLFDIWIVKLDASGELEWEKNFGGANFEQAVSIKQTVNGGYIVAGNYSITDPPNGGIVVERDYWVLKLSNIGELEWEKFYGDENIDDARSIQQTIDGGYIVAGSSSFAFNGALLETDIWIIKIDNMGEIEWEKKLGGTDSDYLTSIKQTIDNGYIIAGFTESYDGDVGGGNNGRTDYWIVKIESSLVNIQQFDFNKGFNISPNPSKGEIIIQSYNHAELFTLKIYDLNGHCILTKKNIIQFTRINNLPKGQYFVTINSKTEFHTQKLLVF